MSKIPSNTLSRVIAASSHRHEADSLLVDRHMGPNNLGISGELATCYVAGVASGVPGVEDVRLVMEMIVNTARSGPGLSIRPVAP